MSEHHASCVDAIDDRRVLRRTAMTPKATPHPNEGSLDQTTIAHSPSRVQPLARPALQSPRKAPATFPITGAGKADVALQDLTPFL